VSVHDPVRPDWNCVGCGHPWPCPTRQRQLVAEFAQAPASLYSLMLTRFAEAAIDLPYAHTGDLHRRFVGWLRRP